MVKTWLGVMAFTAALIYAVWALAPTDRCERVMRASSAIKWGGETYASAVEPWVSHEAVLKVKINTLEWQFAIARFVNRQSGNVCPKYFAQPAAQAPRASTLPSLSNTGAR